MPLIPFPAIAQALGVPQLVRLPFPINTQSLLNQSQNVLSIASALTGGAPVVAKAEALISGVSHLINLQQSVTSTFSQVFGQSQTVIGQAQSVLGVAQGIFGSSSIVGECQKVVSLAKQVSGVLGLGKTVLKSNAPKTGNSSRTPVWGINDKAGKPVFVFDSFISFEITGEDMISKNPVAPNSFGSYNKVARPYEAMIRLSVGGSIDRRTAFLVSLKTALSSTDLYTIVVPEGIYPNANLTRINYERRAEKGVNMIVAELHLEEVRVSATTEFSNTKVPTATAPSNGGTVQPQTPTTPQANAAAGGAH